MLAKDEQGDQADKGEDHSDDLRGADRDVKAKVRAPADKGDGGRGYEHGRSGCDPVELALSEQVYRGGPERDTRETLVGPAEVVPDGGEVDLREDHADAKYRNGD